MGPISIAWEWCRSDWLVKDVRARMGLNIKTKVDATADMASDEERLFAFEAIRELMLNVAKHAKVKSVEVLFSSMGAKRVKLQGRDKGVSYEPKQNHNVNSHYGHFSIQERAELLRGHFEAVSYTHLTLPTKRIV